MRFTPNSSEIAGLPQAVVARQTLVLFDERVSDLPLLYGALLPGAEGYTVSASADAVAEVTRLVARTGAKRLAIVAHGAPGVIYLGRQPLNVAVLQDNYALVQAWGLEEIALYSCEVGADANFVAVLEELTGAKVFASAQKVGAEALGGSQLLQHRHKIRICTYLTGVESNLLNAPSLHQGIVILQNLQIQRLPTQIDAPWLTMGDQSQPLRPSPRHQPRNLSYRIRRSLHRMALSPRQQRTV